MPYQYDVQTPEEYDEYIGMEVLLPRIDGYQHAKVVHIKWSISGELIVLRNGNQKLDFMV